MMKFIFVPNIYQVLQWKQCYYDTTTLNNLIKIIQQSSQFLKLIREQFIMASKHQRSLLKMEHISRCQFRLNDLMQECNRKFYQYSLNEVKTIFEFVQMKTFQLRQKIQRLRTYSSLINRSDSDLLGLLQNVYIQIYYLRRMISYNKTQQSNAIKSYQLNIYQHQYFYDGEVTTRRMDRVQQYVRNLSEQIQELYMLKSMKPQAKAMKQLLFYGDTSAQQNYAQNYSLGFGMGILLILFASGVFLKQYFNITLQTNTRFVAEFGIWRGASYLVFYQWVMGLVLLILQKGKVDYKLILQLQSQFFPKSKSVFVGAQVSTIIFLVFFGVYMLTIGGYIQYNFRYYGQLVWIIILGYLFIPIPFTNNGGKFYFIKLIFFVIISPLTRCNIIIIWLSQQLVSFSQPITDLAFTICKTQNYQSKCNQINQVNMIVLITFFTYRLIQNIKMVYQAGWRIIPPFYGIWRAIASIVTVALSYKYRSDSNEDTLIAWIVSAGVATCAATFADVKGDWGLLNQTFLRKNLIFSNKSFVYYFIIVINIFLRLTWVLNISPSIVKSFNILPYYFIMLLAYLELIRRGMWNILRLEFQHTINCQMFKATVDDSAIQTRVKEKFVSKGGNLDSIKREEYQQMRQKAQMQLVIQLLQKRDDFKESIAKFIVKKQETLQQLRNQLAVYGIKKK